MAKSDDYDSRDDVGWFRAELRQRDRLIAELRSEQDETNDVIRRFEEYEEDYRATMERWRETFDMELTDEGWTWQRFWNEYADLVERHHALVKRWNRAVPILNADTQGVGRPLLASEAQVAWCCDDIGAASRYGRLRLRPRSACRPCAPSLASTTAPIAPRGNAARRSRSTSLSARALEVPEANRRCAAQQVQAV
jgi:hypothetical protein